VAEQTVTPDMRPYVVTWRRRLTAERRARERAAVSARAAAKSCARTLVERFGASRVYLFGSLAADSSRPFGPRSDLDLAVEGLPDARYFEAVGALAEITADVVPIDLVPLETAPPSLRRRVLDHGELLDERT
jgi:predicted nucleotidyltransferase